MDLRGGGVRAVWFFFGAVVLGCVFMFSGAFRGQLYVSDTTATILPPRNLGTLRAGAVTNIYPIHYEKLPIPAATGRAGAIAAAPGLTLYVSRHGHLHRLEGEGFSPLPVPPPFDAAAMAEGFPIPRAADWMGTYDLVLREHGQGWQLFASYAAYDHPSRCLQLKVSTLVLDRDLSAPEGWREVFASQPCLTVGGNQISLLGGGALLLEGDRLLIGVGTFSLDGTTHAGDLAFLQSDETEYGKLVALDLSTGTARHVSKGHRDTTGLARTDDRRLWAIEHGPRGGDELNLVLPGADYGWPLSTYGTDYGRLSWPVTAHPDKEPRSEMPRYAWVPSVAPASMIRLSGAAFADWKGDLLVATLKAASLIRVRTHQGRVVLAEPILVGERVRDIAQTADGTILALLDRLPFVLRIEDPTRGRQGERLRAAPPTMTHCVACHPVGASDAGPGTAPPLTGMIGKPVASYPGYAYSPAFLALEGTWDRVRLDLFLEDPQGFARGTTHPDLDLTAFRRAEVLDWLDAN